MHRSPVHVNSILKGGLCPSANSYRCGVRLPSPVVALDDRHEPPTPPNWPALLLSSNHPIQPRRRRFNRHHRFIVARLRIVLFTSKPLQSTIHPDPIHCPRKHLYNGDDSPSIVLLAEHILISRLSIAECPVFVLRQPSDSAADCRL